MVLRAIGHGVKGQGVKAQLPSATVEFRLPKRNGDVVFVHQGLVYRNTSTLVPAPVLVDYSRCVWSPPVFNNYREDPSLWMPERRLE